MGRKDTARIQIEAALAPGETLRVLATGQPKQGSTGRRLAADVALSTAVSTAFAATGMGIAQTTTAAPVWVAVTDVRFLIFERTKKRRAPVGALLLAIPTAAVDVTARTRVLTTVSVTDRQSGEQVLALNFGMFRSSSADVVHAAHP